MVSRFHWPRAVRLFKMLDYANIPIVLPLGLVSSELLQKRQNRKQDVRSLFVVDSIGDPSVLTKQGRRPSREGPGRIRVLPTDSPRSKAVVTKGRGVFHSQWNCTKSGRLRRQSRLLIRSFEVDQQVKRSYDLPSRISCGFLRSAIRSCFGYLTEIQELSIKTSSNVERRYCRECNETLGDQLLTKWKNERSLSQPVESDHLGLFRAALRRNVDDNWNRGIWPWIPNGHCSLYHDRREGGNWRVEEYSERCGFIAVVSKGKHRLVTTYSSARQRILYPLHKSLYASLERKGWLLVGPPTHEKVINLNGGEYLSVDYSQATDRIKSAYVAAAVEVLIDKGEGLSDSEVRALRDTARLVLDGSIAESGQPMGSLMSFPLLCLVNKTVVDLALNDLLCKGSISFKEWSCHRCLINGDDLLLRAPTCGGDPFLERHAYHGGQVGLVPNKEKTMRHAEKGEINSTLFVNGVEQKKTNLGALFMREDVNDVIGFADRSCLSDALFLLCVRRSKRQLARQEVKFGSRIPCKRYNAVLRCRELRDSLLAVPRTAFVPNAFPVVIKPADYFLSRQEEHDVITSRVDRLRSLGYVKPLPVRAGPPKGSHRSLRRALEKKPGREESILEILARHWEEKKKEAHMEENFELVDMLPEHVCDECSSASGVRRLVCEISSLRREGVRGKRDQVGSDFVTQQDWIPLEGDLL